MPISPSQLSRYSQAPGRLFRSSPKLLHRASGPACRYAGHKSIPSPAISNISPLHPLFLLCGAGCYYFGEDVGKLYTWKGIREAPIAAVFVLYVYLLNLCERSFLKTLEKSFSFQTGSVNSWRFTTSRVFSLYSAAALMSMARVEIHPLGGQISEFRVGLGWACCKHQHIYFRLTTSRIREYRSPRQRKRVKC